MIRLLLAALLLAPAYDTARPDVPPLKRAVLIFSKTAGYRHADQIPHAVAVIGDLARRAGRASYTTENGAVFNDADLARFAVLVLVSSSGDAYSPDQRAALRRWVERGGGVVALHGAGGDPSYAWDWYADTLIGARFVGHPGGGDQFQPAALTVEAPRHPVMAGVARSWRPVDEHYSFAKSPRGRSTVLATIDEASYRPAPGQAMGDHPVIWAHGVGRGRVIYAALGHRPAAYDDANYRRVILNAIRWVGR